MDSAMQLHGGGDAAGGGVPQHGKVWSSAPLPSVGSHSLSHGSPSRSQQMDDALAQHMLLLDLEDLADEAGGSTQPGSPSCLVQQSQHRQQQQQQQQDGADAGREVSSCSSPDRHLMGHDGEDGLLAKQKSVPLTPSGFTPAEAYVDRQERTVFFAKCAPTAPADAVAKVFGAYGEIEEINLFRQWPSAKASRGCGLVVMATTQGAAAAIEALHRKYTWEGVSAPMVCERCCAARLGVKAATQHATRARRTAAAAAARRAARSSSTWHSASMAGARGDSAPLPQQQYALAPVRYVAAPGGPGAMGGVPAVSGGYPSGASAPLPVVLAPGAVPAYVQQQQSHQQQRQYVQSINDARTNSAPLPVVGPPVGVGYGAYVQVPAQAQAGAPAYGPPYNGTQMAGGPGVGVQGMQVSNMPVQQVQEYNVGAGSNQDVTYQVALQTQEQVQLVCDHAATLRALTGAAFWLQPQAGPGGLALSGTPAQLQAATELIGQLLGASTSVAVPSGVHMGGVRWQ